MFPAPNPPPSPPASSPDLPELSSRLLQRIAGELAHDFKTERPTRIGVARGRLDVMGGIADYTGSLVCQATIGRGTAVAIQERDEPVVQVFSFNLLDEHRPFALRMPVEALLSATVGALRTDLAESGRQWAGYVIGSLRLLHEAGLIDLRALGGRSIAVLSDIPMGAGLGSSATLIVATMRAFGPFAGVDELRLAVLAQRVENDIVGAPCGIMDPAAVFLARPGELMCMECQPHNLLPPVTIPPGMRFVGLTSGVKHSVAGGQYARTRCAAFMAHRMIMEKMRQMGEAAGRTLTADPMRGYLANLDAEDYKRHFRASLPNGLAGREFLEQFGQTSDRATQVNPTEVYDVQHAADHHVLEAQRVRKFSQSLSEAAGQTDPQLRGRWLDRAGHLMYASHLSYGNDAMLGCAECDLLVNLVRKRERKGLYGARITGGGCGGTVAVLLEDSSAASAALSEIAVEYRARTGHNASVIPSG